MTSKPPSGNAVYDEAWLDERAEYFEGLYDDLLELRNNGVFKDKNIAVVGAWTNMREIDDVLKRLNLKLTHIADNNPNKQGVSRLGIISQSVESLRSEHELVILVISNRFWKDIQSQLLRLGFKEIKDFYVVFGGEKFRRQSIAAGESLIPSDPEWAEFKHRARLAFESYSSINEKYNGLPIWLMHQPSLGDLYIFSLLLPRVMGVSSVSECECVLIVTKNSVKRLAESLGFKHTELVSYEEANMNWLLLMRLMGEHLNVRNAVYHGLNNIFQSIVHYSAVSFRDSFIKYVFHLEHDVQPVYPVFPKRSEHVLSQFKENGLIPGKTVVISPYAGHFTADISATHWNRLISALMSMGYTLCTNCGSPDELPLPGTAAPFIELQDCVEFVETAGYFIGVRSGFCDLICNTDCRKIVVYETGAPAASIDYFGFESMGIGENITEIVNDCIHTDDMIEQIIGYLLE